MLDLAVNLKLAEKAGAWYSYKGKKIGQGKQNSIDYLNDNLDIYQELEAGVLAHYLPKAVASNKPVKDTDATPPKTNTKE